MKKIFAIILPLVLMMSLTACNDIWYGDKYNDACAFITTSTGELSVVKAFTYSSPAFTAHDRAMKSPYHIYLQEGETATIKFTCDACNHKEVIEAVSAPAVYFFECECVTGDDKPDMCEAIAIDFILGSPPAEEG